MNTVIQQIIERWSLTEGALFETVCTHRMESNPQLSIPFRCGLGSIEYNPDIINEMSEQTVELMLQIEAIRILLKHPYQRQPELCSKEAVSIASNFVVAECHPLDLGLPKPSDFELPDGQCFEWYAKQVEALLPSSEDSEDGDENDSEGNGEDTPEDPSGNESRTENQLDDAANVGLAELSELWKEDCMMTGNINKLITDINESKSWGTLAGSFQEQIMASSAPNVDYRKILLSLKPSVASSRQTLTRMKPSRRFGFDGMGSRTHSCFKLLIGVDTSGSISSESLREFFGVIARLFKYEVGSIDVITFDTQLSKPTRMKKAVKNVVITGRGGTSFQPIVDYAEGHQDYDGLIVFTDGYAEEPKESGRVKIVWVLDSMESYRENVWWLSKHGKCCFIDSRLG